MVTSSGSASWEENVVISDFPVDRRKHLRRGNCFVSLQFQSEPQHLHVLVVCQIFFNLNESNTFFPSLWNAKVAHDTCTRTSC